MLARFVKKEEELDSKAILVHENHNSNVICKNKGISIAERRAATCGFNASNINSSWFRTATVAPPIKSPYFTVPPGISPSALLDSPVMLPNDQAQLSPTTGTFQFTSPNPESLKLKQKVSSYGNTNFTAESSTKPYLLQGVPQLFDHEFKCPMNLQEMGKNNCFVDSLVISETLANKPWSNDTLPTTTMPTNQMLMTQNDANGGEERSKNPNNQEKQHKGPSIPKEVAKYSEDGYYWRKYGQKQVKGSEYPRSYFKCTNTNCQVKKKVERSHDGQITEIVYKGSHNHSKPRPLKWLGEEINEGIKTEGEEDLIRDVTYGLDYGLDITFSSSFLTDFSDPLSKAIEPIDGQELSNTFGNHDGKEKDEPSRDNISFNCDDDENGECEPKRRKIESFTNKTGIMPRSNREPRVVVQVESEIDILDDGYRWRKYGQKVVKGNPNPRSYYKCTTPGCLVRKHVERAANDIKSVITTYEGKHNHEVPCIKNGNLVISDVANPPQTITNMSQKHDHLPKIGKQVQDLPMYIERKSMLNYTDYMMSNMPGNHHDLSFGSTSSLYPLSFPPFPSIPYNSLLLNGIHHMKAFSSSNLCPMLQEYMSMPSPMSHLHRVPTGSSLVNNTINNYPAAIQSCSIRGQEGKIMISKQEHRDDDADGSYEASSCLSFPNHGN